MIKFLTFFLLFLAFFTPTVTFATPPENLGALVDIIVTLIDALVVAIVAFAVLGFFWGLAKYILSAQDSTKVEEGRKIMVWGIIALFVMVSVWGILRILLSTFFDSGNGTEIPTTEIIDI